MKFSWSARYMRTGKSFQTKYKILILCVLRAIMDRSPDWLRRSLDISARGMFLETDVKFRIGTVFDFFVFSKDWENPIANFFSFTEGITFLDVGAHIGKYTIRGGLKAGKNGRVIAIEPNKKNYRVLVQNINLNGLKNCIPLNIAAYHSDSEITLYTGSDSAKNSIKANSGRGSQKVKARALDNVLRELGVEKVDLVKIDVEEAEYDVVRGLENTLRHNSPLVMVEILRKDEGRVIRFLNGLGYKENLLSSLSYKDGLMFYSFEKKSMENIKF